MYQWQAQRERVTNVNMERFTALYIYVHMEKQRELQITKGINEKMAKNRELLMPRGKESHVLYCTYDKIERVTNAKSHLYLWQGRESY